MEAIETYKLLQIRAIIQHGTGGIVPLQYQRMGKMIVREMHGAKLGAFRRWVGALAF